MSKLLNILNTIKQHGNIPAEEKAQIQAHHAEVVKAEAAKQEAIQQAEVAKQAAAAAAAKQQAEDAKKAEDARKAQEEKDKKASEDAKKAQENADKINDLNLKFKDAETIFNNTKTQYDKVENKKDLADQAVIDANNKYDTLLNAKNQRKINDDVFKKDANATKEDLTALISHYNLLNDLIKVRDYSYELINTFKNAKFDVTLDTLQQASNFLEKSLVKNLNFIENDHVTTISTFSDEIKEFTQILINNFLNDKDFLNKVKEDKRTIDTFFSIKTSELFNNNKTIELILSNNTPDNKTIQINFEENIYNQFNDLFHNIKEYISKLISYSFREARDGGVLIAPKQFIEKITDSSGNNVEKFIYNEQSKDAQNRPTIEHFVGMHKVIAKHLAHFKTIVGLDINASFEDVVNAFSQSVAQKPEELFPVELRDHFKNFFNDEDKFETDLNAVLKELNTATSIANDAQKEFETAKSNLVTAETELNTTKQLKADAEAKAEQERKAKEAKEKAEEAKKVEEAKKAEEARKAEEAKKAADATKLKEVSEYMPNLVKHYNDVQDLFTAIEYLDSVEKLAKFSYNQKISTLSMPYIKKVFNKDQVAEACTFLNGFKSKFENLPGDINKNFDKELPAYLKVFIDGGCGPNSASFETSITSIDKLISKLDDAKDKINFVANKCGSDFAPGNLKDANGQLKFDCFGYDLNKANLSGFKDEIAKQISNFKAARGLDQTDDLNTVKASYDNYCTSHNGEEFCQPQFIQSLDEILSQFSA